MNCWWPKTPGDKQNPGTVSKSKSIVWAGSFIFQPQMLECQQGVKPAVQAVCHGNDMICMCTCTFKHIVSHMPIIKPNKTK